MSVSKIDRKLVICECNSSNHQLIFSRFEDEEEVYVDFHLVEIKGFWERLRLALKYLFKNSAPYNHFDGIILGEENINELAQWLRNGKDERVA